MHHGRGFAITIFANIVRVFSASLLVNLLMLVPLRQAVGQQPTGVSVSAGEAERRVSEINVSIVVFDPGVPADPRVYRRQQVFSKIREVEAFLLPFMLRETLIETNEWGAVRIVPVPDVAAELLVSGEITRSDGNALELQVRAVDASGRVWLDNIYMSLAATSSGQSDIRSDSSAYQELFNSIAEDLRFARSGYDEVALSGILDISFLRYADQLAPSVFGGYLYNAPDGSFTIQRLPAGNDPMLGRIERIRQSEYLFIDTVDEKFQDLHAEIESIYDLWVDYRYQVAQYENDEVERVKNSRSNAPSNSYEAIRSLYDNYSWGRMQEQRRDGRAEAFDNEVGPIVSEMESRVAELEDWLEQQYAEWRTLLAELFFLETGLEE